MARNAELNSSFTTCSVFKVNLVSGHTDDFSCMLESLLERYPNTKLVLVGFSLGGNLISKYLGEDRKRPTNIIGGVSICQGYNAIE